MKDTRELEIVFFNATRVELAWLVYTLWMPALNKPHFDNTSPAGRFLRSLERALVLEGEDPPPHFPWFRDLGGREAAAALGRDYPAMIEASQIPSWSKKHALFCVDFTKRAIEEEDRAYRLSQTAISPKGN